MSRVQTLAVLIIMALTSCAFHLSLPFVDLEIGEVEASQVTSR